VFLYFVRQPADFNFHFIGICETVLTSSGEFYLSTVRLSIPSNLRAGHVGYMMDKMTLEQDFSH
jgi:hypothetical protein